MTTTLDLEQMLREASPHVTRPRIAVSVAAHAHPRADTETI